MLMIQLYFMHQVNNRLRKNINEDLVYLNNYVVTNKLSLNIQKCEFLTVGTQQHLTKFKHVNIQIDEIDIVKVTTSKYLGFIIDQTLRWGHHVDSMMKKISSQIGVLLMTIRNALWTMRLLYSLTFFLQMTKLHFTSKYTHHAIQCNCTTSF